MTRLQVFTVFSGCVQLGGAVFMVYAALRSLRQTKEMAKKTGEWSAQFNTILDAYGSAFESFRVRGEAILGPLEKKRPAPPTIH